MDDQAIERNKRSDAVLGIIVAAAIGFLLNLLGNVYYDLFVIHTTTWDKIDHGQVYTIGFLLLGLIGFLQFFIDDYKNALELNRSLLKRYVRYFFYQFGPGKLIRIVTGIYVLLTLLVILGLIYFLVAASVGYPAATAIFVLMIIVTSVSEVIKNRHARSNMEGGESR